MTGKRQVVGLNPRVCLSSYLTSWRAWRVTFSMLSRRGRVRVGDSRPGSRHRLPPGGRGAQGMRPAPAPTHARTRATSERMRCKPAPSPIAHGLSTGLRCWHQHQSTQHQPSTAGMACDAVKSGHADDKGERTETVLSGKERARRRVLRHPGAGARSTV